VQSLMNLVPTVYVNDRGITFQRCNAGFQGLSISPFNRAAGGGAGPEAQKVVQVYIDGTRVTMDKNASVLDAIGLVHPRDIQAVEVYTGVARIPAEFLNDACAVIAIWTKSY